MNRRNILLFVGFLILLMSAGVLMTLQDGKRLLSETVARFEQDVGVLDLAAYVPADVEDEDNAAFWLKQGVEMLTFGDQDRGALNVLLGTDQQIPDDAIEALLARNMEALATLRRAGAAPASSWGLDYSANSPSQAPDLLGHLWAAKCLAADAVTALAVEDRERLAADVRGLAAFHRALSNEPLLVFQLMATHIEWIHLEIVQRVLSSRLADPAIEAELAAELDRRSTSRSFERTFAVDAIGLKREMDRLAQRAGIWDRLWSFPERIKASSNLARGIEFFHRSSFAAQIPAAEIESLMRFDNVPPGVAEILVPNLIDGLEKHRATEASRQLAQLALDLRQYAVDRVVDQGSYPASVDELATEVAANPYGGGELQYVLSPDGSVSLSFPGAEAYWRENTVQTAKPRVQPRFTWRLPALNEPDRPDSG